MAMALEVIQPHDTWKVVDPSKLSTYMACPRKYFFNHILGWQSSYPNNDLLFGTCWHMAMDHIASNNFSLESVEEAKLLFLARYRQEMPETMDKDNEPKNPAYACAGIDSYVTRFRGDIHTLKKLHTEIGGVVLISPTAELHFKMDWIGKDMESNKYIYIDYKTSKWFAQNWADKYTFSLQMLTYYHVLHCLFPKEQVGECRIRGSFFRKKAGTEHDEKGLFKTADQMNAFLVRANVWYQNLQYDMQLLEEENTDNSVMLSFAQNDQCCFQYNRKCIYYSLCENWGNPINRADWMPANFKQEFWDPRKSETIKEVVDLTTINMDEIHPF